MVLSYAAIVRVSHSNEKPCLPEEARERASAIGPIHRIECQRNLFAELQALRIDHGKHDPYWAPRLKAEHRPLRHRRLFSRVCMR